MVDNVCLHEARIDELKVDKETSFDEETARRMIPLNPIPIANEGEPKKKSLKPVDIQNEMGISAGKFGWCMVCRNKADLYCKDTKHPVCSYECKKKHVALVE